MSPHVTMRSPQRRQRMVQTFEAEPAAAPPTAPPAKPPLRKGMSGFQMAGFLSPAEAEAKAAAMAAAEADAAAEAESKVALEAESKEMAAAFWAAHADQEAAAAVSRRWAVAGAVVVAGASVAALVAARPDDARRAAAAVVVAGAHAHRAVAGVLRARAARCAERARGIGAGKRENAGAARSRAPGSDIRGLWGRLAPRA